MPATKAGRSQPKRPSGTCSHQEAQSINRRSHPASFVATSVTDEPVSSTAAVLFNAFGFPAFRNALRNLNILLKHSAIFGAAARTTRSSLGSWSSSDWSTGSPLVGRAVTTANCHPCRARCRHNAAGRRPPIRFIGGKTSAITRHLMVRIFHRTSAESAESGSSGCCIHYARRVSAQKVIRFGIHGTTCRSSVCFANLSPA